MAIPVLNEKQILDHIKIQKNPDYYAFYSSWFGGITTDSQWVLIPMDDHMTHRGDGVFEAMKAVGRHVYLLDEHLDRLFVSAEMIKIKPALSPEKMKEIILATLKVADQPNASIRVFLSRGPGNFSVNPYDTIGPQLYVIIHTLKLFSPEKYQEGVTIGKSNIPLKTSWMATVKSCNYLPNVMMKKEAVDRGLEFVIGINENDLLGEGPTENILMIDPQGILIYPHFDSILKGTTLSRLCELAKEKGIKTEARAISMNDLLSAKEVMMCGTTLDVLPVVKFENHLVNDGKPGPLARLFREMIQDDIQKGPRRTVF